MLITLSLCVLVSLQRNMRCNYTKNPAIMLESSVCVKLLLWAQDYCPTPKWQTQNTVRVIRVIAKPTIWKTSTVLVPSTQPITVQKLCRESVQLKYSLCGRNTNLKSSSGVLLPFSHLFHSLSLFYTNMYELVFNMCTCIFIHSFEVSFAGPCYRPHLKDMPIHCISFMHVYVEMRLVLFICFFSLSTHRRAQKWDLLKIYLLHKLFSWRYFSVCFSYTGRIMSWGNCQSSLLLQLFLICLFASGLLVMEKKKC